MTTLQVKVAAGTDDGLDTGSAIDNTVTQTSMAAAPSARTFFRFADVTIPQGATIVSATATFYRSSTKGTTRTFPSTADAADNSAVPTTRAELIARPLTAGDSVTATTGAVNSAVVITCQTALQAVVNRAGWASGNAFQLIMAVEGGAIAVFHRDNGNAAYYPTLDVDYTTGGGGPPAPAQPALIRNVARFRAANF